MKALNLESEPPCYIGRWVDEVCDDQFENLQALQNNDRLQT